MAEPHILRAGPTVLDALHDASSFKVVGNPEHGKNRFGKIRYSIENELAHLSRDSLFGQRIVHATTAEVLDGWPCGIADPLVRPSESA